MNNDIIWTSFLDNIKQKISSLTYETWFKDTKLLSIIDHTATIIVPLHIHKKHLKDNYYNLISELLNSIVDDQLICEFKLKDEIVIDDTTEKQDSFISSLQSNLNSNYSFDNFIVGDSNRFAFTASRAVAEQPGNAYNPLFLYGKSGLGKTHLMQSIGNYIVENTNLKVLYISSDKFVNDYICAVRYNDKNNFEKIDNFKSKYRNVDVLMIDDIQFLGGAIKGQEEFFHTFNELYNLNKQIIIASDRSVDDLKSLENRLITRFNWGLTANITPPDFELRMNIIRKKIAYQETAKFVPDEVIEYIANNFDSDIRQLEGSITRVFAYSLMMNKGEITLDTAVEALKDNLIDKSVFKNNIHRIQQVVCDYYKISLDDMKSKKRNYNINYPRKVAIFLCRNLTTESFPKIGTYFGGRDHSTIINSYNKIKKDLDNNEQLSNIIDELKSKLS